MADGPSNHREHSPSSRRDDGVSEPVALPPIIVADDEEDVLRQFPRFLAKLRLVNPLHLARDGDEVLAYLDQVARNEALRPALVLLDLHMPKKTGLEALRVIRSDPTLEDLPVVVLTGWSSMEEVQECHALGVASYLVKPVGFAALNDVLREVATSWALLGQ